MIFVIVIVIVIINRRTAMQIKVFYINDFTTLNVNMSKTSTVLDVKTAVMEAVVVPRS